jgi:hypothetical protein
MTRLLKRAITGLALVLGWLACGASADAAFSVYAPGGGAYFDNPTWDDAPAPNGVEFVNAKVGAGDLLAWTPFAPSSLMFTGNTGAGGQPFQLRLEIASFETFNQLWVHNSDGSYAKIFDGADSEVTSATITVTNPFELVLLSAANGRAYFSGSNTSYQNASFTGNVFSGTLMSGNSYNFAAFKDANPTVSTDPLLDTQGLWIAMEDLPMFVPLGHPHTESDGDYNDMVIRITQVDGGGGVDPLPVPAPPGLILALIGILPCLALRRRLTAKVA